MWAVANDDREIAHMQHADFVHAMAFSPDGQYLAIASGHTLAQVWDIRQHMPVARMQHNGYAHALAFSPDGSSLATASYDRTAKVWQAMSGDQKDPSIMAHGERLLPLARMANSWLPPVLIALHGSGRQRVGEK
jgi:WD40 repeat protein